MGLLRFLARAMFAWIFIAAGIKTATEPGGRGDLVAASVPVPVPAPDLLVRINGGLMVVGGAALALGIKPRLAALGLAATLVPTTYVGHRFWEQSEAGARRNQQIHFNKNVTMIGALLTYALTEDD
jgi:putative oxidoreductase